MPSPRSLLRTVLWSTTTLGVVIGFVFICVLGELRAQAVETELLGHRSLTNAAVKRADSLLAATGAMLQSQDSTRVKSVSLPPAADSPPRNTKPLSPVVDSARARDTVEQNLAATQALDALALDVLDHMQQIGHAMSRGFDSSLTANVAQGAGLSVLTKVHQDRFARTRDSSWKTWHVAATKYYSNLSAETAALTRAANDAQPSIVPDLWSHPIVRLKIVLADAFMGRSPSEFIVKLFYAVTFLLIGGGIALVTARLLGAVEPDESFKDLIKNSLENTPGLSAIAPLIAPIGLVAALAGGYVVAQSSQEDPADQHERGGHIEVLTSRDTSRRVVTITDTAGRAETRAAVEDLKASVARIEQGYARMNDTLNSIASRAK